MTELRRLVAAGALAVDPPDHIARGDGRDECVAGEGGCREGGGAGGGGGPMVPRYSLPRCIYVYTSRCAAAPSLSWSQIALN